MVWRPAQACCPLPQLCQLHVLQSAEGRGAQLPQGSTAAASVLPLCARLPSADRQGLRQQSLGCLEAPALNGQHQQQQVPPISGQARVPLHCLPVNLEALLRLTPSQARLWHVQLTLSWQAQQACYLR